MRTSASQRVFVSPDPDAEKSKYSVEFKLTYEGMLKGSGGSDNRPDHKHFVRRHFHPQLKRLWEITPHLRHMTDPPVRLIEINPKGFRPRTQALAERFQRGKYQFVPLVTRDLDVAVCELDILFLRPDSPGSILQSGDIDGRLKTLFDALKVPQDQIEMGKSTEPAEGETPLYVLLQDDDLITKVTVETGILLEPIGGKEIQKHDARLVIGVHLEPSVVPLDMRFWSTIVGFKT